MSSEHPASGGIFKYRSSSEHDPVREPLLLAACCICGLIRDDSERGLSASCWTTLTTYRNTHRVESIDLLFTHTYCPVCLAQVQNNVRRYYAELRTSP